MHKLFIACGAVLVAVLGMAVPASASAPIAGSGAGTLGPFTVTSLRVADGNTILSLVQTVSYTGVITGTATQTATVVVHPNGTLTGQGIQVCDNCSVDGVTGDMTSVFTNQGMADLSFYSSNFAFLRATGDLAGLRAQGQATGSGNSFTYTLNYHF